MQATVAENAPAITTNSEVLDIRGICPPENILCVLRRVSELAEGATLEIRSDTNPMQLYDLLQQRGFFLRMQRQADGAYDGTIHPRDIKPPSHPAAP